MYSRAQWYLLTVVRWSCLLVLIVVVGNRVQKMQLPSWAELALGALVIVIATMIGNSWAVLYDTYVEDYEREKSKGR